MSQRFRTAAGSTVEISGRHGGISEIAFDWFEEGACIEAHPVCETTDPQDAWLYWHCECCGDGQTKLEVAA